jgi:two-component system KDP operon response regulator KdpE
MSSASSQVLIVEDSELAADALKILFESRGYAVRVAPSVKAAVDACASAPTDLMLLDLTLPDGDGLAVLAAVSALGVRPRVTVALTGHDDPALAERCRAAGCLEVLLKPVPVRELLVRASAWLI